MFYRKILLLFNFLHPYKAFLKELNMQKIINFTIWRTTKESIMEK